MLQIILLSISLALDASSVNIANGMSKNIKKRELLLCSFIFGVFQFLMPLFSYLIGTSFKDKLESIIPYISFSLLLLLSIKSFFEFIKEIRINKKEINSESKKIKDEEVKRISFLKILIEGIATSIDALCIGFIYVAYSINEALIIFRVIGIITLILSFLAGILSKFFLNRFSKYTSLITAIIFLLVGIKILVEGLI